MPGPEGTYRRLRFLLDRTDSRNRKRLNSLSSEVTFVPMEAIGERGELDVSEIRNINDVRTGYSVFLEGDVLVAKITPCFENGKGAVVRGTLSGIGYGTTEVHVLTAGPELDSRFLYYVTVSPEFRKRGECFMTGAAGQQRIPEEYVRDFRVMVTSLDYQRAVANYLDSETCRIDALISTKRRLLTLLAEKRKAIIASAVMRGLDPHARFRDSGVPWIGEVPANWQVERTRWLFSERDQRSEPALPLMEVSIAAGVTVRDFMSDRIEGTAADFNSYKVARKGDIAFNKMRMWQGAVGVAPTDGLVSPDYVVAAPLEGLSSAYAGALFRTEQFSAECRRRSHGITWDRLRIYWDEFREIELPVPPHEEQRSIVEWITRQTAKLDELRIATERTTGLLIERRAALIDAAVTGRVDVGAVA